MVGKLAVSLAGHDKGSIFLVIREGSTRVLPVAMPPMTTLDRVVEMMPDLVDKVEKYFDKKEEKEPQ